MGIGNFFNTITSPIGIKAFPGGPYADRGMGDKAMQSVQTLPGLNDLGALGSLPQIYAQIAELNGLPNPFASMMSGQPQTAQVTPRVGGQQQQVRNPAQPQPQMDPYALSPASEREYARRTDALAQQKKAQISRIRAKLSARGLGDSSAMTAAEMYLEQKYGGAAREEESNLRGDEFNRRNALLQSFVSGLYDMFNAQRQRGMDKAGVYSQQGQLAEQRQGNAMDQLGTFIALLSGGRDPRDIFKSPRGTPGINPNSGGAYQMGDFNPPSGWTA